MRTLRLPAAILAIAILASGCLAGETLDPAKATPTPSTHANATSKAHASAPASANATSAPVANATAATNASKAPRANVSYTSESDFIAGAGAVEPSAPDACVDGSVAAERKDHVEVAKNARGGACWLIPHDVTSFSSIAHDAVNHTLAIRAIFRDAKGTSVGEVSYCSETRAVKLPAGAAILTIMVGKEDGTACAPAAGADGKIWVTFR